VLTDSRLVLRRGAIWLLAGGRWSGPPLAPPLHRSPPSPSVFSAPSSPEQTAAARAQTAAHDEDEDEGEGERVGWGAFRQAVRVRTKLSAAALPDDELRQLMEEAGAREGNGYTITAAELQRLLAMVGAHLALQDSQACGAAADPLCSPPPAAAAAAEEAAPAGVGTASVTPGSCLTLPPLGATDGGGHPAGRRDYHREVVDVRALAEVGEAAQRLSLRRAFQAGALTHRELEAAQARLRARQHAAVRGVAGTIAAERHVITRGQAQAAAAAVAEEEEGEERRPKGQYSALQQWWQQQLLDLRSVLAGVVPSGARSYRSVGAICLGWLTHWLAGCMGTVHRAGRSTHGRVWHGWSWLWRTAVAAPTPPRPPWTVARR
jgi:hypothetical protein